MNPKSYQLSTRQKPTGENHHLWNNHGIWWFHGTRVFKDGSKKRVRCSLKTPSLEKARRLRDHILAQAAAPGRASAGG
jgi:hypothetical protein